MDWFTDTPIAHRGLHGDDVAENSLAAFRAAMDAGYPIELDVNMTADGVLIVYHHDRFNWPEPGEDPIRQAPWTDVIEYPIEGDRQVPRLGVALQVIDGEVPILVDVKNWNREVGDLEATLIERLDGYDGPFAIQSFNPATLAYFRGHRPSWPRGQVAGGLSDADTLSRLEHAVLKRLMLSWWSRPDFITYAHRALPYWPVRIHRRLGLPVLAWTIRSAAERREVAPHAENIIFEGFRP